MVIIDPNRDGCDIYNDMMASYIKGHPAEVCRDILNRVCCGIDNCGRPRQVITVGVVMGGYGSHYHDVLREMGLQYVVEIQNKHIELVFPVLCDRDCRGALT